MKNRTFAIAVVSAALTCLAVGASAAPSPVKKKPAPSKPVKGGEQSQPSGGGSTGGGSGGSSGGGSGGSSGGGSEGSQG